jgi:ABC-2 type transport system ATP-binding protein
VIIETAALVKRYEQHEALAGIDLAVPAGSVYGLVGPNGAGKTTLLALLAGLRQPTSGVIRIAAERTRVALLPDTPQFDPWLTGREVVSLAQTLVTGRQDRVEEVLSDAGLTDAADRRVGGYSRGMLQRLGLAATIVGDPEVLLLDEPASALDPAGRREVLDLIARLRGRATVVLSSHILGDVEEVCDRIGIMRAGRLMFQGTLDELLVGRAGPAYRIQLRAPLGPVVGALREQPWVIAVEPGGPEAIRLTVRSLADAEAELPAVLAACGARVVSLGPLAPDLENVFLELTGAS